MIILYILQHIRLLFVLEKEKAKLKQAIVKKQIIRTDKLQYATYIKTTACPLNTT